jgi:glucose-1-phosphate thymidylyltransferase
MKGIILAGGSGTRLYPITIGISKQLLPIYDKPMVYYPLSVLLLAGIKEILLISTPEDIDNFKKLLKDGSQWGVSIKYKIQNSPDGLAQAFILGEDFIGNEDVCLVLGDNIFYGHGLTKLLNNAKKRLVDERISTVFGYYVSDPERYGVVAFDNSGKVTSIEEKPLIPKSNFAVVGLYFYTNDVVSISKTLIPSERGELEITSVNQEYLKKEKLKVELMGRGYAWLDTGTHESLLEASLFIQTIEKRQGLKVACIEEIVYEKNFISKDQLIHLIKPLEKTNYGQYLKHLISKN